MVTEQESSEEGRKEPEFNIEPGDVGGLMAEYPHIREWVEQFEAEHGSRPIYYGPLDRDAKSVSPRNLIYATKPPCFAHVYSPPEGAEGAGNTFWFGLEPHHHRGGGRNQGPYRGEAPQRRPPEGAIRQ